MSDIQTRELIQSVKVAALFADKVALPKEGALLLCNLAAVTLGDHDQWLEDAKIEREQDTRMVKVVCGVCVTANIAVIVLGMFL